MSHIYEDEEEIDWAAFGLPQAFGKSNIQVEQEGIGKKRVEADTAKKKENFDYDGKSDEWVGQAVKTTGNFATIGRKGKTKFNNLKRKNEENTYMNKELTDEDEKRGNEEEEKDTEEDEIDEEDKTSKTKLPVSYEVEIPAHEKIVSALDITSKGSRMISGGFDYMVRLWDFNGMTTSMKSYRQIEPKEGLTIQSLCYSSSSSLFLCCMGGAICNIYNTDDGTTVQQTVQGDMYIRDTANTKGHTHMTTDCKWHPTNNQLFITSSLDATIRMWDLTSKPYGIDQALPSVQCLKAVDRRNLNISNCHVLCCEYTKRDAKCIAGGCVDGSIQFWNEKRNFGKPDRVIREAHKADVVNLVFFNDNNRLLSRSLDDTMKLWDIRQTKSYVFEWKNLAPVQSKTNICISPSEDLILTGTQCDSKNTPGKLCIFNSSNYKFVKSIDFEGVGVVKIIWHSDLNQIVVGCTNGKIKMFYDPIISKKGALLFVKRVPTRHNIDVGDLKKEIYTPESFPTGYKETREGLFMKVKLRGREKERYERETQKTIVPPFPTGKDGSGGVAAIGGNFSQYALRKFNPAATEIENAEEKDIVEALRQHANASETNSLISKLYQTTQPHKILDYSMEQADDEELLANTKKCPRCGLKLCQCGFMQVDDTLQARYKQQRKK